MFRQLAGALGVVMLTAGIAAAPARAADREAVVQAADTCPPDVDYMPHGDDPAKFIQCDSGRRPFIKSCPQGTWWDQQLSVCNWPAGVSPQPTRLSAGTASLRQVPPGLRNLNATVTWGGGRPVALGKVEFTTTRGQRLCAAETDYAGRASCDAGGGLPVQELFNGYTATYSGHDTLESSTDHGTVRVLPAR